jgi:surface polysaccharide O-acyltransferase-like enzyme
MAVIADYVDVRGNKALSLRIDFLRLYAVLMVVCFHIAPTPDYSFTQTNPLLQDDFVVFVKFIFRQLLPAGSMSLLPAITGLLVFAKPTQRPYMDNAKKWGRSLLMPYLTWGIILAVFFYTAIALGVSTHIFRSTELTAYNVADAIIGIDGLPIDYPLYFLRNMFGLLLDSFHN